MKPRISKVGAVKVNAMRESAIFHIGDSVGYNPRSNGFALDRLNPTFTEPENIFSNSIYHMPIPKPYFTENVLMNKQDVSPSIRVGGIRIIAIGNASVFQIGSTKYIDTESRIKHVRLFD